MVATPVLEFDDRHWGAEGPTHHAEPLLESGAVLSFPRLAFALRDDERRFLDARWTDGKAKNISLRWPAGDLRGAVGADADLVALCALVARFADCSEAFALRLFPHYRGALRRGGTSFRPVQAAGRTSSQRKDDTLLHVDAFPSNPTRGTRLLRVFSNLNPRGEPRQWRVGEPFEAHAQRFLPAISRPWPGSAALLRLLRITKRHRTEYDHMMLRLHDLAKADAAYQRDGPQSRVDFAAGCTWVVFSDQVPHAVLAGQYMLEQTFNLEVEQMQRPETSPLRTLERLTGRALR